LSELFPLRSGGPGQETDENADQTAC